MKNIHWVLIRGLVRETRHWGNFPEELAKCSAKVTTLELPGVGERKNETSPLKIDEYVEDLRKEFLKIENDAPKALCAISMGGMIAQAWLAKYPEDFCSAVIINSSGGNLSPIYHRLTPAALKLLTSLFASNDVEGRVEAILKKTTNMVNIDDKLLARWSSFEREHPTSRVSFLRQIKAAASFKVPNNIEVPTLFIASAKDQFVSAKCSTKLAQHYNKSLVIHPEAGHDLPLDDPSWLCEKIASFSQA